MKNTAAALAFLFLLTSAASAAPPIADPGVDNTEFQECTGFGFATFQLNGLASIDPEGGSLSYSWSGPFGTVSGPTPMVSVPLGVHEITLTVTDQDAEFGSATFTAIVIDTQPPVVDVTLAPSVVSAGGALATISAFVDVRDVCGSGTFVLDGVTTNDPLDNSIQNATLGAPDTSFAVVASLTSVGGIRTYTATYTGIDNAGNTATGSATVVIGGVGQRPFIVGPDKMTFDYTIGGSSPSSRLATVTSEHYSSFHIRSTASWLSGAPVDGETPGEISVSVNPEGLEPGTHAADLLVESGAGFVEPIRVTLRLHGEPDMFSLPEALSLSFDTYTGVGGAVAQISPLVEQVFVGSRQSPGKLTISTDAAWLSALSSAATTPSYVTVAANPAGLAAGTYVGQVTIESDNPLSNVITLPVTLSIASSVEFLVPEFVLHSATMKRLPVAPGSLITAFYFNHKGVTANAESMPLPTELGGLSATVDGEPVRFIHVSPMQFNAQLPTGLETGVSHMQLRFDGELMGSIPLQIVPAAPGVFTHQGHALVVNQDGSVNGPENPAPRGAAVSLYLTGQGPTEPALSAGQPAPGAPFATPRLPLVVEADGRAIEPQFAGMAPGQAGLLQVNLMTGAMPPGPCNVKVTVGGAPSNVAVVHVAQ